MKTCSRCILNVLVSLLVFFCYGTASGGGNDVAEELIQSVVNKYNKLRTYKDQGRVITRFTKNGVEEFEEQIKFHTHIFNPNKLKLEWVKYLPVVKPRVSVLLENSCGIHAISPSGQIEKFDSLDGALTALTGVSGTIQI